MATNMRKRIKIRKFGRQSSQRKALLKSLSNELFLRGRITTTEAKAKELKKTADKHITMAKKNSLANQRHLLRFFSQSIVKKLVSQIGPQYKDRPGGYTRIMKLGSRNSDGARMAVIELIKSQ